jgi:hypothetical protein
MYVGGTAGFFYYATVFDIKRTLQSVFLVDKGVSGAKPERLL